LTNTKYITGDECKQDRIHRHSKLVCNSTHIHIVLYFTPTAIYKTKHQCSVAVTAFVTSTKLSYVKPS